MNTGVPTGTSASAAGCPPCRARMQPSEAALPTVSEFGVAWIASRSPPGQPAISFVWWPESARAQQP